ncbi:hypothetical protein HOC37_01645, partial [bacterium]|nr:hypothetical protein [bacterium]
VETAKLGRWQRPAHGGIPYEVKDGKLVRYRVGNQSFWLAFGTGNGVNLSWKGSTQHHTGIRKVGEGRYEESCNFMRKIGCFLYGLERKMSP